MIIEGRWQKSNASYCGSYTTADGDSNLLLKIALGLQLAKMSYMTLNPEAGSV